ncbi:alanine racemase [Spirochaetia bacterium]|nr:alanine racemase [Spirochaetia bacterium]
MRATRAIIHLDHFGGNFQAIRERIGSERQICVPVKADAYGHGALRIARAALETGASCLAVATVGEGTELREGGVKIPILLLSQPLYGEIPGILKAGLTPFVSDAAFADALNREAAAAGLKLPVHLKIDTGMGRMGCSPAEAPALARFIAGCSNSRSCSDSQGCTALDYAGTATHLAVADSAAPEDIDYTQKQIECFKETLAGIQSAGLNPGIVHAANSGAVLLHPNAWFDMVRPGILLYGYKAEEPSLFAPLQVKPVMELRTNVVFIKKVKKGETLSYGRTWTAPQDTNAAVLPVGYGDGLPRLVSNKWQVYICGRAYPLVGRICMDQCLADLGPETNVRLWDEVTVFGGDAPDAAVLAERIGTIPYEITCNINKRVPRVYEN